METPFLRLAELCNSLEQISKTSEKIEAVSKFLGTLNETEIEPAVFLIVIFNNKCENISLYF